MKSTLMFGLLTMVAYAHAMPSGCLQGVNCHLPDCFCHTLNHPTLAVKDIPQMVYFGFDDALTGQVDQYYQQLFNPNRRNPNGCPITMSLYVQNDWTIYDLVSAHFQQGNEIGSHSVNHVNVDTKEQLVAEAGGQKENLAQKGQIPLDEILGWRSPNLKPAGDAQPEVLQQFNYTYDISLTYTRGSVSDKIAWPFTLDNGYPYRCGVPPCPSKNSSFPGFWEVPVNLLFNPETNLPCVYVDACRPTDEQTAFEYLKSNFEKVYASSRAPFGLNMHAAWFYTPHYLKATHRFLDYLVKKNDVYVISVKQVLEWMRNPVKLSEAHNFPGWGCADPVNITTTATTTVDPSHPASNSTTTTPSSNVTTTLMSSTTREPTAVTSSVPSEPQVCMQGVNCHLPSCQCRTMQPPAGLTLAETPQIIFLTMIGGVDSYSQYSLLKDLLHQTNPNGCPISATFFVPRTSPNNFEQSLRNDGHEIAMYYSKTSAPGQLSVSANLGFRASFDSHRDDSLFSVLNASDVLYDSSLVMSQRPQSLQAELPWPYTLDFGWKETCNGQTKCPKERYSGLWEVPIIPLVDYMKTRYVCTYADACYNQPPTAETTSMFFQQNLDSFNTNRAPMGIHLRKDWFFIPNYKTINREGLQNFLKDVLARGNVYVLSVEKMLDWMRNPTSLDRIGSLDSWKC